MVIRTRCPCNPCTRRTALRWALVVGIGIWVLVPLSAAEETPDQIVDSMYGSDLKKAKATPDTKDDLALAAKFIADAKASQKNKGFLLALARRAILLSLEDAGGAASAQTATELIASTGALPAQAAWQELADKAAAVLRRRNLGKADKLLEPWYGWLMQLAREAITAGDTASADRVLAALVRDAQTNRLKYLADEAQQMQARTRFDAPFQSAAKREWAKLKTAPTDPKLNLDVAQAVLAQTGDWNSVLPLLMVANDPRWNLAMQMHELRLHPPVPPSAPEKDAEPAPAVVPAPPATPKPDAVTILTAVDALADAAAPARHPSLPGRAFLLSEAASLAAQAQQADQAGLTTAQKLDFANRLRLAQEAATKGQDDLNAALDRALRLPWVPLLSKNIAADWTQVGTGTKWEILPNGELQGNGDWDSALRSTHVKPSDFVLEAEILRKADVAHAFFLLREHNGSPVYSLEIGEDHIHFLFAKGGGVEEREVAKSDAGSPQNRWLPVKIVMDGDRCLVWLDGKLIIDVHDSGEISAGTICLGAAKAEVQFRNLRVRELP